VVRHGRTLVVTHAEVFAVNHGKKALDAVMQRTNIAVCEKKKHVR
jgi:hypothetical protein